MRRRYGYGVLVALLLTLFQWPLFSQSQATTGVIEGTVRDSGGDVLPGVVVTLTNTATNFEQALVTGPRGRFRGVLLPLGPYRVTARLEGFATLVRDGVELSVGQTIRLELTLELSTVRQEIVVTDEAPLIETSRTESSTRIDRDALERLPDNGRNFLNFLQLTPGVSIVQGPDGEEITINGQKGIQNNIAVDGADFNNPFFGEHRGGQRPAFTFNLDAVQEFVVVAQGAPAEFGRSSGGFVNVVTKSGTNELHGTGHLFLQDDSLSARAERSDGSREPSFEAERQQFGFTLGGPVVADKLFYFTALDVQRGTTTKQTDPSRIEQRVVDAFAALGSPNENGPIDRDDDAEVFLGKIDWQAGKGNLFTARYNHTNSEQPNGTFDVDSWGRSANAVEEDDSNALSATLISTLSTRVLNEGRFQWAREDRPRPYNGPNVSGQDRPLPDTAFDFGRQYRFGLPFFIPIRYHDTRWQVNDNLTWLTGTHTLKGGIEWNQTAAFQTFIGFANGRFIFSSTDGFLSYLDNPNYVECSDGSSSGDGTCPAGTEIVGPVLLYLQQAGVGDTSVEQAGTQTITQDEIGVFLQDTWQPRANLTVQYGLRWEGMFQPDPVTPAQDVFFAPFIGQTVAGQEFPSNGGIPDDDAMWQPRLGVSWDPGSNGKTVLRANLGVYHARVPGLMLASSRSTNGSLGQTLFRSSAASPFLGPVPAYPNLLPQSEIGDPFLPDVFVFDKDFRNPRTRAASFTLEREIAPHYSLLVKFSWARADRLTRVLNMNDPLLGSPWSTGLGEDGTNGINNLSTIESGGESLYQGYTVGLKRRWFDNLSFHAYYTYSKDRSNDDNERDPFTFRYARITDLDREWGFSDRDQRDRFNGWLLWTAPKNVNVNLRYSYRSPQPVSLTETGAVAGTPADRINADGTVTRRNRGRKDNKISALDLRVSRPFSLGGARLEIIGEVFNLANTSNFRRPEVTNLIFNFDGTVQSGGGDPRRGQVGIRVVW